MENRNGLIAAAMVTTADGYAERKAALLMLADKQKGRSRRITVGAGSLLAMEVRSVVTASVLLAEALLRSPGADQRAIHGKVIVRHEALRLRGHGGEELLRHIAGQQTFAVLREHRMVPYRVVHAQADEPAGQQVVVQLLDQLPLRTLSTHNSIDEGSVKEV